MKKILSVILAALMLIGSVSFQAAAYEKPEPPYIWHIIEIEEIVEEVRSAFKDLILQSFTVRDATAIQKKLEGIK